MTPIVVSRLSRIAVITARPGLVVQLAPAPRRAGAAYPQIFTLGPIASSAAAFGPAVTVGGGAGATVTVTSIPSSGVAFGPSLTVGGASLSVGAIPSSAVAFGPAVSVGPATVVLGTIASSAVAFGPATALTPVITQIERIAFVGDSQTANSASQASIWAANRPAGTTSVTNDGVGGSDIAQMKARLPNTVPADTQAIILLAGANGIAESTAAAFTAAVFDYVAFAKAQRPGVLVMVCGTLDVDEVRANKAGHNAKAAVVRANFRAAVGDQIDGYIPLGEHPDLDMTTTADSGDGLHLTTAGYNKINAIMRAAVLPLIAGANATRPDAFLFADNANAPPSSAVGARVLLTGQRRGYASPATVTGAGIIARGKGGYGTAGFTVVNGDIVSVADTSSAAAGQTRETVVTIGGRSDTFSVTTAAAVAATMVAGDKVTFPTGDYGSAPFTASVPFGAGTPAFAMRKEFASSGATINGVAATKVSASYVKDNLEYSIYVGNAPVAAGNRTVVVNGANNHDAAIYPITLTGVTSISGSTKREFVYSADGPLPCAAELTIVSGGLGANFVFSDPGSRDPTYPNAKLERKYADGFRWVSFTSTQTPSITGLDYCNTAQLAVSLVP